MIVLLFLIVIVNSLTIIEPTQFAGNYDHLTANFGPQPPYYNITNTEAVVVLDNIYGCDRFKGISGKLVLVLRGKCSFYNKAFRVQQGSGKGLIVGNLPNIYMDTIVGNNILTPYEFVYMSVPRSMRSRIRIPSVMIPYSTFKFLYILTGLDKVYLTLNYKGDIFFMNVEIIQWEIFKEVVIIIFIVICILVLLITLYNVCGVIDRFRDNNHILRMLLEIKEFVWEPEVVEELNIYNTKCSICFDNLDGTVSDEDESEIDVVIDSGTEIKIKVLRCKHAFHSECIDPWIEIHNKCPLCKTSIVDLLDTRYKRFHLGLYFYHNSIMKCLFYLARLFFLLICVPVHFINYLYEKVRNYFR